MLALRLIIGLLAEAAAYAAFIYAYTGASTSGLPQAILIVLAIAIGVRAIITGYMFLISETHKCARPKDKQIGALKFMRLFLAELRALTLAFGVLHPLVRIFGPLDPPEEARKSGTPVVLVHGFMCNAGYWHPMRRALQQAGIYNLWAISLEPLDGDIERLADQLAGRVEDVLAKTGASHVILVGHSMGGLVSRAYARRPGNESRVRKIITLGSPHHGTVHAKGSRAKNGRQMQINNDWLNDLNREEDNPPAVPIVSLFSYHDNIVAPQDTSILKHAEENIGFPGIGHLEMSFSPAFQREVVRALKSTSLKSQAESVVG